MSPTGARGGRQHIPRPPNFVLGQDAPWADLDPNERRFPLALVRARLEALRDPDRTQVASGALVEDLRPSSVLIPLFEEHGEARVVLTRRPDHLPTHQGQVAFPGGKFEPNVDRDARDTALREADEEIGLPRDAVEIVAELDHLPSVGGPFTIAPFVGLLTGRPTLAPSPDEVDRVFDVALTDLTEPGVHHLEIWEFEWGPHPGPFFAIADETIWGATARMLTSLLTILLGAPTSSPANLETESPENRFPA
ncbi:MAG: CoA pyrophosphatase [Acidimicrobiia bacterium]